MPTLLRVVLQQVASTVRLYVAPQHRAATLAEVATRLRALVASAAPGSDNQLQLVTAFASFAVAGDDVAHVRALLAGTTVLDGLAIDTEMRWTLLTSLAAAGAAGQDEIDAELERDRTATGQERAARAAAAVPTAAAKVQAWGLAVEQDGLANQTVDAIALGFGTVHDPQLLAPYVATYHEVLSDVWASRTHAIAESIVQGFYPVALADQALLEASQSWLDGTPDAPPALRRLVAENRDGVSRAMAAQTRDAAP